MKQGFLGYSTAATWTIQQQPTTQLTEIQVQSKQGSEGFGHHDDRVAEVGKIDHE